MTVLITLTTAGTDSGPFNLYTNLDGYVTAFATGVAKSALVAGYTSTVVPDGATIIRVKSAGACTNYVDLTISGSTTTTTTSSSSTTTTTTTSGTVYYTFNLTAGTVGCNGSITWTPIGAITAYSDSPTLEIGVILYTLPNLITPITYDAVKSGIQIYELTGGEISQIVTVGSGC